MKYTDVFSALCIMSPSCLAPGVGGPANPKELEAVKTPSNSAKLPFNLRTQLASAAAWSPNPKNPPLYLGLPSKNGKPDPDGIAKWAANSPLAFVDRYIGNVRQYKAISTDVGGQGGLRAGAAKLHEAMDDYGIPNTFEVYPGTHTSAVAVRFRNFLMPFSSNLCFDKSCK